VPVIESDGGTAACSSKRAEDAATTPAAQEFTSGDDDDGGGGKEVGEGKEGVAAEVKVPLLLASKLLLWSHQRLQSAVPASVSPHPVTFIAVVTCAKGRDDDDEEEATPSSSTLPPSPQWRPSGLITKGFAAGIHVKERKRRLAAADLFEVDPLSTGSWLGWATTTPCPPRVNTTQTPPSFEDVGDNNDDDGGGGGDAVSEKATISRRGRRCADSASKSFAAAACSTKASRALVWADEKAAHASSLGTTPAAAAAAGAGAAAVASRFA